MALLVGGYGLFNSSLDGISRRAMDIIEGDAIDEATLKALASESVAPNLARATGPGKRRG